MTLLFVLALRSFAIDVTPASDWRAEALATALATDLVDDRLALAHGAPDLAVHLRLGAHEVAFELDPQWAGAPPSRAGVIGLAGIDRPTLAAKLRDELHKLARVTRDDRVETTLAPPSVAAVGLGVVGVAMLVAIPFVLGRRRRAVPWPAVRHAAIALGGTAVLALAIAATGAKAAWLGLGGLAWGTWIAVTMPIVFPPLVGFGRIEQGELARVLASWSAAVARRALAAMALYLPIAIVTWLVADGVVVPLVLLAVRLWIRCTLAVAAQELDARLFDATADRDAWEAATRAYVIGYLRRAGLAVDTERLARVQLVPGNTAEVVVYGDGLTASRIVIPRRMLELALAPWGRPHDYGAPRVSTLHWSEWNAGLIMPTEMDAVLATAEQRQPQPITDDGEADREVLGEPPTLAGTVEPSDYDPEPRAYRPHDDPMWLDFDSGDDYDGTDAGDRDFLFGAVVHALGEIQRHADRLATIHLLVPRLPWRAFTVGDHHAALAGARHHLVQYLGWRLWQREDLLTARAFAPELESTSSRVLAEVGATTTGDRQLRDRIVRLADPHRPTRLQRVAMAGAIVACVGVVGVAIASAVRYHATFEETSHGQD
jgi:hypothetical protein